MKIGRSIHGAKAVAPLLIVGVVALGGGMALAQDGNTIRACAHKTTGALRLDSPAGGCNVSETPVTWNTQGPQGPRGEAAPRLFALVRSGHLGDPGPYLRASSGVISVERSQQGFYSLVFDRDVADCAAVASITSFNGGYPGNRVASTVHWPHIESMRTTIGVRTQFFTAGEFHDADSSFNLTVAC